MSELQKYQDNVRAANAEIQGQRQKISLHCVIRLKARAATE